ncbi:MAG: hypothetical protein K9G46_05970 [Flavobacteriales bacterium]|jgi:hypothetical protein|nr:hypothetical protein [Flavobacteriales bacterium]
MKTTWITLAICLGFSSSLLAQSKPENVVTATNSEKIQLRTSEVSKPEPKLAASEKLTQAANAKSREKGKPELKEFSGKNPKED